MSEATEVHETTDVALAAFICVYESSSPAKITTDISDPFTAVYHFRMRKADFQSARDKFVGDQAVTGIQTFVTEVRRLQALAEKCDRVCGGILSL